MLRMSARWESPTRCPPPPLEQEPPQAGSDRQASTFRRIRPACPVPPAAVARQHFLEAVEAARWSCGLSFWSCCQLEPAWPPWTGSQKRLRGALLRGRAAADAAASRQDCRRPHLQTKHPWTRQEQSSKSPSAHPPRTVCLQTFSHDCQSLVALGASTMRN